MAWDKDLDKNGVAYNIAAAAGDRIRVIAGPGTGKSYAMKRRVARLLEENVPPAQVLAVTFTRVAAEDLHRELQKLDVHGCEDLEGVTLHGLGMRILARSHVLQMMGRHPRPLNSFELKAMYQDIGPSNGGITATRALVQAYESAWAQSQGDPPGFPKTDEEKSFQQHLIDWHMFHESMLIGEIIPYLVRYLKENPQADEHTEFKHVLADEYQDLNKAEQTSIAYLSEKSLSASSATTTSRSIRSSMLIRTAFGSGKRSIRRVPISRWRTVSAAPSRSWRWPIHLSPTTKIAPLGSSSRSTPGAKEVLRSFN